MKTKTHTLIGFAVKARKTIFGADYIEKSPRVCLIICDKTLAEGTLKRMIAVAGEKNPIIISQNPLEDIVFKQGVKAMGITDRQMAKALVDTLCEGFEVYKKD